MADLNDYLVDTQMSRDNQNPSSGKMFSAKNKLFYVGKFLHDIFDAVSGSVRIKINKISEDLDVQYPLPTDGDSVYYKDIDVANSDNGDFTGEVTDYFNSLKTVNSNSTTDNPKIIKIWFKRSVQIQSIGFGCDNLGESFSNIKIKALGSGEAVRYTKDLSSDDEKRNSYLVELPPLALNGVQIEFHTEDKVCLSNLIIFKAIDTISRMKAISDLTGDVEGITSYRGALNVNSAWVHRKIVNETFYKLNGLSTTLAVQANAGDTQLQVVDGSGFSTGDELKICQSDTQEIGLLTITNVAGNILTLDRTLANTYTVGLNVCKVDSNMAVNGSLANPLTFKIKPPTGTKWQITRFLISITDGSAMDDGLFGGIPELSNGVVLKAITEAGRTVVFGNWKNNGDIKLDMYDVEYSDKAPAGENGLRGRWTFTKAEVVAEINGDDPLQEMEVVIQDDLTDLTSFRIKAQGRVFSP